MKKLNILAGLVAVVSCINAGCSSGVEKDFKRACKTMVGEKDICNCVYEETELHYGKQQLQDIFTGKVPLPTEYPEVTEKVIYTCAAKLSR